MVQGLLQLFKHLGGTIQLNAPVERIDLEGNHAVAVWSHGQRLACDQVASNAVIVHTYRNLLAGEARGIEKAKRLQTKRFSMSLFVIHFGLKKEHPALRHHMVCFGTRYRELIHDIFHGHELPDEFSLFLHSPSVTDASLAPPGCSAHYVLAPVPHLGNAPVDWTIEGVKLRDRILAVLSSAIFQTCGKIC